MRLSYLLLFSLMIVRFPAVEAQPYILDRVVAVVGEYHILQSEIENTYLQNRAQGVSMPEHPKCWLLEEMLSQKLLVNQAKIDSIIVSEGTVEMELEGRLQYFTNMIGSEEALEEYFGKSILEIKSDMRESVRESILTRQMQSNITQDVSVTPSEIEAFYENMPRDSIPYIDSKIEIAQIVMYPEIDEETDFEVKQQLLELRRRILDGENFKTLAVLYSEDPGSAPRGGELGFRGRGELDPAYTKAAFSLTEGGVSPIVESQFGYHLIQLIERRDDRVNTRHILMRPKIKPESITTTKQRLDSLSRLIRLDSLSFARAARLFSEDKNTAVNGGTMVNPVDFTTQFKMDELQTSEFLALRDLDVGEITEPFQSVDENAKQVFKIIWLKSRSEAHRANMQQDYGVLQQLTLEKKKQEVFQDWLKEKVAETYVRIDDSFAACPFSKQGWVK